MADPQVANELTFNSRQTKYILIILAVVLFIVFGFIWWEKVYKSPERTFWGMFDASLSTPGFTRHIQGTTNGESVDEYEQVKLGGDNIAQSFTTVQKSATKVSTETISTVNVAYNRYTSIVSSAKGSNGQPLNYNKVVGVWVKSSPLAGQDPNDPLTYLFGQALIGKVPIGNLSSQQRADLVNEIRTQHAFTTNFADVKTEQENGREVYVYSVTVEPPAYGTLMKNFAKDIGLGKSNELDSTNFQSASLYKLQFIVDVVSRELVEISEPGTNYTEQYSGYGLQPAINVPKNPLSFSEFQKRFDQLQ